MKNSIVKQMTLIAMFVVILAVCSYITIPMSAVPFTLQTFAVFACLLLLGGRNGTIAIATFILMGALGLPVFSGMTGGVGVLFGMTGGYIMGFLLAGFIYWIGEAIFKDKLLFNIIALIIGLLVCYAFGSIWFKIIYTSNNETTITFAYILSVCVIPFILPDLAKMALAVLISLKLKKFVRK